jgi:hypothetical protein
VTYLSLEGEAGLRNRIAALENHTGAEISSNFRAIIQPFSFGEEQDVVDLAAVLATNGVIIIDTLNRASAGMDENSGQDMSRILKAGKHLQELTDSLVLVVHHTGKDTSKGMRGHSSLHAALDGAIEVERTGANRLWRAAKVKDGLDGEAVAFKLELVPLGLDADGDLVNSCAVGPAILAKPPRKEPSGGSQRAALKAVRDATRKSEESGFAGSGQDTLCVTMEEGVTAVAGALISVPPNKKKNNARRIIQGLISRDFLRAGSEGDEEWLWCLDG